MLPALPFPSSLSPSPCDQGAKPWRTTPARRHSRCSAPPTSARIAHLYRGEVYRSTVWRTRLDATTNWAVVATGIALSVTFSSASASPLPLALVGLLVAVFLSIEARRYRFFDFWRMRAHVLELQFFGPILRGQGIRTDNGWNEILYNDYIHPSLHISLIEAIGRRLRRNYGWIFTIQVVAYTGKLLIHPEPITHISELWQRAAIGPIPGQLVLLAGSTLPWQLDVDRVHDPTQPAGRRSATAPAATQDRMLQLAGHPVRRAEACRRLAGCAMRRGPPRMPRQKGIEEERGRALPAGAWPRQPSSRSSMRRTAVSSMPK